MAVDIFEFKDYRDYLKTLIGLKPKRGRGFRSALAQALNCHSSHISQVLQGKTHFTPEQAQDANLFLGHLPDEAEYFLLMVHWGRAGTVALKSQLEGQIRKFQQQRLNLKERFRIKKTLSVEDQAYYYSAWHYAAIHLAVAVDGLQTEEALMRRLGLSRPIVSEAIEFLVHIGLVAEQAGHYAIGENRIFLGADSPLISKHHANWRMKAVRSLESGADERDLHYSSVITISSEDWAKVRKMLIESIDGVRKVLKDSKDEELLCVAVDLFRV